MVGCRVSTAEAAAAAAACVQDVTRAQSIHFELIAFREGGRPGADGHPVLGGLLLASAAAGLAGHVPSRQVATGSSAVLAHRRADGGPAQRVSLCTWIESLASDQTCTTTLNASAWWHLGMKILVLGCLFSATHNAS